MRLIDADRFKDNIMSGLYVFCQENKEDIARAIDSEPTVKPIIDNAPTVEPDMEFAKECYANGYEDGKNERPQGEWLKDKVAFHFVCNQCGCALRQLKSEVFEGDYDYNFCPNCGAKMKGGAE